MLIFKKGLCCCSLFRRALLLGVFLLALNTSFAFSEQAIPPLSDRVVDKAKVLTKSEKGVLEGELKRIEKETGAQIAILTIDTVRPETIEQFSIRVAESWRLGRKGVDDGILILLAKLDRQIRIEVGYGLEGAIPDAVAKRIIDEQITPWFREGRFFNGLQAGVLSLEKRIQGEQLPPPVETRVPIGLSPFITSCIFLAFLTMPFSRSMRIRFGALPLPSAMSIMVFLVSAFSTLPIPIAFLIAMVVFFALLAASYSGPGLGGGVGGWRGGSGGFGGGSFGGGGFSGGGGSFGGGGASGSW